MKPTWLETDLACPYCGGRVLYRFDGEPTIENLSTRCETQDINDHPYWPGLWDDVHTRLVFLENQ